MKSPFDRMPRVLRPIAARIGQGRLRLRTVAVVVIVLMVLGIVSTAIFNFGAGGDITVLGVTFWFVSAFLGIFYALLANKLHTWLQRHARNRLNAPPSEFFRNHDLTKAFGHAIEMILLDAADPVDGDTLSQPQQPETKEWLSINASKAVTAWTQALSEDHKQRDKRWARVWESKASIWVEHRKVAALDDELWYMFLSRMNGWWPLPFTEDSDDARAIIMRLNARFGEAFWEVIKNDAAGDGYQAKALDLVVNAELLRRTRRTENLTEQMKASQDAMAREWDEHREKVKKALKEQGVRIAAINRIASSVQVTVNQIHDLCSRYLPEIHTRLEKMEQSFSQFVQRLAETAQQSQAQGESEAEMEARIRRKVEEDVRSKYDELVPDQEARISTLTRGFLTVAHDPKRFEEIRKTGNGRLILDALQALLVADHGVDEATTIQRHREILEWAFLIGNIDEAERSASIILALQPNDLDATNRLGHIHYRRGELLDAEMCYRRVLNSSCGDPMVQATAYGNLGNVMQTRGDLDGAERMYREALKIDEKLARPEGMANQYGNLGLIMQLRGDLDGAERMHRKSLEIEEKLSRREGIARERGNLGVLLRKRGDLDGAEQMHRKALEINEGIPCLEGIASEYGNLGNVLQLRGDLDGAERMHRKALEINKRIPCPEGMADDYDNLGLIMQRRGNHDAAREMWTTSRDLYTRLGALHMVDKVQGWLDALPPHPPADPADP